LPPETFPDLKISQNAFAAEDPPRTPLGELTALAIPLARLGEGKGRKMTEGRKGKKEEGRERQGSKGRETPQTKSLGTALVPTVILNCIFCLSISLCVY